MIKEQFIRQEIITHDVTCMERTLSWHVRVSQVRSRIMNLGPHFSVQLEDKHSI